ncbi:MAG: hypothetical protein GX986_05555 [Firmicutes bacterium]|nr:hypothetical protein [Bacillota bacterium]
MELQQQYMRDDEIDLREVFIVLWKGKWVIVALVLVAAVAAGLGGRILLTPTYNAVATLLIMPPTYQTAIEPETLALETYRDLALTPSIATQVIAHLQLTNKDNEPLTADDILRKVSVEVSAPQPKRDEIAQSAGILRIRVSWSDPNLARDVANTWADVFMMSTSSIRKSESDGVAQVILKQFDSTEMALKEAERDLLQFKATYSIPLASQQIELLRAQLGERRKYILNTQTELEMKRHQLTTLEKQVNALEHEGEWIGLLTRDVSSFKDDGHPIRNRTREAIGQVLRSEAAFASFEDAARMSMIQQDLDAEMTRLSNYKDKLANLRIEEPRLEAQLASLAVSLEQQDPKLVMLRSVTTDALWNTLGNRKDEAPLSLEDLSNLRLVDESVNQNYRYVERMYIDTQLQLANIPKKVAAYEELVSESTEIISDSESRLRELQQEKKAFQDQVILSRQLYDSLKEQYISLKQNSTRLQLEVARLETELQLALPELGKYEEAVAQAERELLALRLEEDWLNRNVEALRSTHSALSGRAESARLAELQATGDVRFVSQAVAPRSPSGPDNRLNVAIAAVLGGMLGIGVVFIRNMFAEPIR